MRSTARECGQVLEIRPSDLQQRIVSGRCVEVRFDASAFQKRTDKNPPTRDLKGCVTQGYYSAPGEVGMKWAESVALVFVAVMTLAILLSVHACREINKEIDCCDDQTSGAYIRDAAARRSERGR
jgi:hypothetical protein